MKHLTTRKAWWSNTCDQFGQVRFGLEMANGDRSTVGLANSVEEAETKAKAVADERNIPAELIDFKGADEERKAGARRLTRRRAAQAEERARNVDALKTVTPAEAWSLDADLSDATYGWPGVVINEPPADDRLPVSKRLADRAAENLRFEMMSSRALLAMEPRERPEYHGTVFAVVSHPDHGEIAVTDEEFKALDLPEVSIA